MTKYQLTEDDRRKMDAVTPEEAEARLDRALARMARLQTAAAN